MGTDEVEAKKVASEANTIIAEQRTRQVLSVNDRLARMKGRRTDITAEERTLLSLSGLISILKFRTDG